MKMNIINKRISNIIMLALKRNNSITMKKEGTIIKIKEEEEVNIMIQIMERLIIIKREGVKAITTSKIIRRKRTRNMIIKIQGVIIHKSSMKIRVKDMINILLNISNNHIMMMELRAKNMKVIQKLMNMKLQAIKINLIRERLLRSKQKLLRESNLRKKSINNLIKMWIRRDRQEAVSLMQMPIDSKYSALNEDSLLKLYD